MLLDRRVGQPDLAQPFRATPFEPEQIVGVIDNAHLISVAIDDSVGSDVGNFEQGVFHSKSIIIDFGDILNACE